MMKWFAKRKIARARAARIVGEVYNGSAKPPRQFVADKPVRMVWDNTPFPSEQSRVSPMGWRAGR